MKLFKLIFLLIILFNFRFDKLYCPEESIGFNQEISINQSNEQPKNPELSEKDQEELKKYASSLIEAFNPNILPEEKQKMIDDTLKETVQMDNYLKGLPEEERLKEEKKIEEAVSYMMSPESPIKDLFNEKNGKVPVSKNEEKLIENFNPPIVEEKKEPFQIYDVKDIKNVLETIANRIWPFLIKVNSMPCISCKDDIIKKWENLKNSLIIVESSLKIISKKNNLLDILQKNAENQDLKDNLYLLKDEFSKKIILDFNVPDTAGLTIVFDNDEEDEENVEFITSQKQLEGIINCLDIIFSNGLINYLSDFMKKNAPTELKQNPELAKKFEKIETNQSDNTGQSNFLAGNNRRQLRNIDYPTQPDRSGNFNPAFFNPEAFINSPNLNGDLSTIKNGSDSDPIKSNKDKDSQNSKKGSVHIPNFLSSKEVSKDKNSVDDNHKKLEIPKTSKVLGKQIKELETSLENLSKSLKKIQTYSKENKDENKKDKNIFEEFSTKDKLIEVRDLPSNLNEVDMHYEKTIKGANKINASINLQNKNEREQLSKYIKQLYNNPDLYLENYYENLKKMYLNKLDNLNLDKNSRDDLLQKLSVITKKYEELKKIIGLSKGN